MADSDLSLKLGEARDGGAVDKVGGNLRREELKVFIFA